MTRTMMTAAALIALAAPVAASEQLARSLGVDPDAYTLSELAKLKAASTETGNEARVRLSDDANDMAMRAQLAASIGVDPEAYTLEELAQLKAAASETGNDGTVYLGDAENPGVGAGEAQMATALGVDPADYTLAELSELYIERFGGEDGSI